tara:strand:+ start:13099 stop:13545 length:447 start_codon:yes stop_codon:yes gene_type:complete
MYNRGINNFFRSVLINSEQKMLFQKSTAIIFLTCFSVLGCDSNAFPEGLSQTHKSTFIEDEFGNSVVNSYVLVALNADFNNGNEALRLARIVDGKVIGSISELNIWQIEVDSSSHSELAALIALLEKEPSVRYGIIDVVVDGDHLPRQ